MHFFRKSKPKEKKAWVIEEVHENLEYNSDDSDGDHDGGTRKGKNDRIPMLSIQSNTNNDNDIDNDYATTHHNNNQNSIINSPVKKKQQKQKKKKKWQQMPLENKIEKAQQEERPIIQYPGFMKLQYKSGGGQLVGGKKTTMKTKNQPPSTTTHREASELTFIRSNRTNDNESMDDTSISRLSLTSSTTTTTEAETATIALTRTPSVPAWTYATRQDYEAQLSDNVNIESLSYWTGGLLGESNNNNSKNISSKNISSKNQNNNQNKDKNSATMPANDTVIDVGSSSSSSVSPKTKTNTRTRTRSSNITNTNGEILTAEDANATNEESVWKNFASTSFHRTSSSSLRSIPEEEGEDNEEEEEEDEDENQDVKALQEKLCALHTKIAVATEAAKQRVKEKHKNNTIELVLVEAEVQGGPLSTNCYGPHFLGNTSLGAQPQPQHQQQSPSSPAPSPLITRPTTATALLHKLKFVGTAKKEEKSGTTHKSDLTATIVSCSRTTTSSPPSLSVGAPSNSLITCTSQEFYAQEVNGGGSIILDSVAALKSVLSNNNVSAAEENHTNTEERKVQTQEKGGSYILDSVAALKSVLTNNTVSAKENQNNNTVDVTSSNNNTTTKDHRGSTIIQPGVVDTVATTPSLLESINRISNIMCAQCTPLSPEKKKQYGDNNDIAEEEEDRDDVDENGESSIVNNTLSETRYMVSTSPETRHCQSREEVAVVEDHDNYDVRIIAEASTLEDQYYDNEDDDRDDVDDDNNNDHRNSAEMEGKEAVNQHIIVGSPSSSTSTSSSSSSSSSPDATTPEQQQIRSLQKTIEELKASLQPNTRSSPNEEASSTPTPAPTPKSTPTPPPAPTPTPPTPTPPIPTPVLVVPTPLLQPLLVRNHDTRNEAAWKRCAPRSQYDKKTNSVIQFPIPNLPIPKKRVSSNDTEEKKGTNNTSKEGSRSSLWYTNFFERFPSLEGMSKTKNAVAAVTTTTTPTTGEILESSE